MKCDPHEGSQYLINMDHNFNQLKQSGHEFTPSLRVAIILALLPETYETTVKLYLKTTPLEDRSMQTLLLELQNRELEYPKQQKPQAPAAFSTARPKAPRCDFCRRPGHSTTACWQPGGQGEAKAPWNLQKSSTTKQASAYTISAPPTTDTSFMLDSGSSETWSPHSHLFQSLTPTTRTLVTASGEEIQIKVLASSTPTPQPVPEPQSEYP